MRRRQFIGGLGATAAWSAGSRHGLAAGAPLVAMAYSGRATDPVVPERMAAFAEGLAAQGWTRGESVDIAIRYASADPALMDSVARELLAIEPAALFSVTTPNTRSVLKLTQDVPVVFIQVSDPVASGFVESLARPGHNATGFTNFEPAMAGRWLELLKELAPKTSRVGALFNPETAVRRGRFFLDGLKPAASRAALTVEYLEVGSDDDIVAKVKGLAAKPNSGLVIIPDTFTATHRHTIVDAARRFEIATVYWDRQFPEAGGLISYGNDITDHFRAGGDYIGRILNGASPAELPVQAPTKFQLLLNLQTAAAQGITVPPGLLAAATQVIE